MSQQARVIPFEHLRMGDVDQVGGKNASLGEMISQLADAGIRVPGGFATTAFAFREFLAHNDLEARIAARLATLDVDDVAALARAGAEIRGWIAEAPLPPALNADLAGAYRTPDGIVARGDLGRAIVGDRRRPAGGFVCRTAGNIS